MHPFIRKHLVRTATLTPLALLVYGIATLSITISKIKVPKADDFSILYGPDLFLGADPTPIYTTGLLKFRSTQAGVLTIFSSTKDDQVYTTQTRSDLIEINPKRVGSMATLYVRPEHEMYPDTIVSRPLRVFKAPAAASAERKVLHIGDSIANTTLAEVRSRLLRIGFSIVPIGTIANPGFVGESRAGRLLLNYTGKILGNGTEPLPEGQEAAYLALSDNPGDPNGRLQFNPFLKSASAEDRALQPQNIFDSYIFDMRYYLQRFGFQDPDDVFINLGTNDIIYVGDKAFKFLRVGIVGLYKQIRAALPNANIFLVNNANARSSIGARLWQDGVQSRPDTIIRELLRLKVTENDPRLFILPAWAHHSPDIGWTTKTTEVDASTGSIKAVISDAVHPAGETGAQYSKFIADALAGVWASQSETTIGAR